MSGLYILTLLALAVAVGWAVVRWVERIERAEPVQTTPTYLNAPAPGFVRQYASCDDCGAPTFIDIPSGDWHRINWREFRLDCPKCIRKVAR